MGPKTGKVVHSVRGERRISAGNFKAHCLALMDEVERTGRELVVTKRGRPVARLAPMTRKARGPLFGRMRGTVTLRGDVVAPIAADWNVGEDL